MARVEIAASLEHAGAIAEAAMRAGATGLTGPVPDYPDEAAVRPDLLREAVADARAKAEAIAGAAGRELGQVVSVTEPRYGDAIQATSMEVADHGDGPPSRPGPRTVSATVRVLFAL